MEPAQHKTNTSRDIWRKILKVLIVVGAIATEIALALIMFVFFVLSQNTNTDETLKVTGIVFIVGTLVIVVVAVALYKLTGHLLRSTPTPPQHGQE